MKKLKFVLGLAGIFTLMMLSSCSNLDPFGKDAQNSNEKNYVSFTINTSPSGRFIAADSSYDITAVKEWELSYTEESTDDVAPKTITYTKGSTTTDSTTTYLTEEESSLKVCNFPVGTYTFELTGTYTDANKGSHTVYGKATAVKIVSGKTNSISIIVGSKRTETGKGSLDLTFTNLFSDNNNYESLSISLVNLTNKEAAKIDLDYSITEKLELKINKTDIPSGLYKIEITYPNYKISIDNGDCFVEIADNVTTTKSDITLSCETKKIFYATNKESSYNGLHPVSPKNLTRLLLLNNIVYIEEQNISIYMGDESPEIDIAVVNSIKEKKLGKTIDIYKGTPASEKKCLSIYDSGIDISGELTLIPNGDTDLEVSSIVVNQEDASAYTITLKDGASLNIENANLANALTIAAIDSTAGKDNFLAYMTTPFITAKTDISNNLKLSYVEENATQYTILPQVSADKTTYSYYLKPSSTSGLNVQSYTDAKITAQYENDATVYTTGENVEIPYTNATLTFSLSGIKDKTVTVIDWYLNDKSLNDKSLDAVNFNPYGNNYVNVDDNNNNNTVTCLFSVDGTPYISEFKFKLVQIKTTAVYSYSNPNNKYAQISYVKDYTIPTGDSIYVKDKNFGNQTYGDYEDFYWCLDNASNLYVLWNMILYKYSYDSNSYNTTEENIKDLTSDITEPYTVKDIYYSNGSIYLLENNNSDINVYQVQVNKSPVNFSTAKISNGNNLSFNQIAVYGNDIYVSADTSIYKMGFEQNGETITLENPEVFYSSISTDFPDSSDEIKITDLQIGDGCGNNPDTLFALVRDIDSASVSDSSETLYKYYSRGGLLSISTVNKNSNVYGYNNTNSSTSTYTVYNNSIKHVLYSPKQDSTTEFFGPTHFCAVVPKKLVILDDGFVFVGNNEVGEVLVSKKDGFMEFDIAKESLNKYSENINAFEYWDSNKSLFGTGFDTTDYYGKQ